MTKYDIVIKDILERIRTLESKLETTEKIEPEFNLDFPDLVKATWVTSIKYICPFCNNLINDTSDEAMKYNYYGDKIESLLLECPECETNFNVTVEKL